MADSQYPRISFGIIVANGEPFTRYCLRSLYPFAYEIIVVEGGGQAARSVTTPDGHSIDGTLETLLKFKQEEDPENKIQIITRDGHWLGKDSFGGSRTQQSQAYAERVTGDYLWQIDIDEFYKEDDMLSIIRKLTNDRTISTISFITQTFWVRPEYKVDGWHLRDGPYQRNGGGEETHRIFKWGPNYKYVAHEPPTVVDEQGRDLRTLHWVRGKEIAREGIFMYHYSLIFPWQVKQKVIVNNNELPKDYKEIITWAENSYFHLKSPYRVHRPYQLPSWIERYRGSHPKQPIQMIRDVEHEVVQIEMRPVEDVEKLLNSWWYPCGRWFLKVGWEVHIRVWLMRVRLGKVKRWLFRKLSPSS